VPEIEVKYNLFFVVNCLAQELWWWNLRYTASRQIFTFLSPWLQSSL